MGQIKDGFETAFRDHVISGVPASGSHEPIKSDIRAIGRLIETGLSNIGLGSLVDIAYPTKAELDGDLAHAADSIALVYGDATDANNDLYVKSGASGAGAWTNSGALHEIIGGLAQPHVDEAQAWAEGVAPGGAGTKSAKEHADAAGAEIEAVLNGVAIRGGGAAIDGETPLGVIGANDAAGDFWSFIAMMPDGTIKSAAIEAMVSSHVGGFGFSLAQISGFSLAFIQEDAGGVPYVLAGIRDDGSFFAWGGSVGGPSGGKSIVYHDQGLGQSNEDGDEAKPVLSTDATGWGSLKFSRGLNTWSATDNPNAPAARAANGFGLVALAQSNVERYANGFADHFKAKVSGVSRFATGDQSDGDSVLVSMSSLGGRKLTELGPINDGASGNPGVRIPGGHYPTLIDDIARAKAAVEAEGYTYILLGLNYDQGESEASDLKTYYTGAVLSPSVVLSDYVTNGLSLVSTYDADARAASGDSRPKPTFFNPPSNTLIATAHRQIVNSSALAFSFGPRYHMPSALNASNGLSGSSQAWGNFIHHTSDAQRWKGEMRAKIKNRVMVLGEAWDALHVVSAEKTDAATIRVHLAGGKGDLVIDTERLVKLRGWGFQIYDGTFDAPTNRQYPTAISIAGPRALDLTFATIPAGAMMVIGYSGRAEIGVTPAIASVAAAAASADGFAREAVTIASDLSAELAPLESEGVFYAFSSGGAQMTVREVQYSGGSTVLIGETREKTGTFTAGDTLDFGRIFQGTNVRDSDDAMALNSFANGPRAGELYPLENWLEFYEGLEIEGA